MNTALTEMFGIEHPILLAPMGNVSGGALTAAVTAAGGLGILGAGYGDPAWLERELALAEGGSFGVGFITWSLDANPEALAIALAAEPVAVMFSFGDFRPFGARVRDAGAKIVAQVQTVAGARQAAADGAELIVAQGTEAGGHGSRRSTFSLVPAVVDAVHPVPVVAAGGVSDGRGLAAALMLGACGVLVGTRFYATPEALGAEDAKRRIVAAEGDGTVRTRIFDIVRDKRWPENFTGRAVRNDFVERWHGREVELWENVAGERERYEAAVQAGDAGTTVIFAGEGVDMIDAIEPAGAVVHRMVSSAEQLLGRSAEERQAGA